jgi:hypothetical protein
MRSGADRPTGPSSNDEYGQQYYRGHPESPSAQVVPVSEGMPPSQREPLLSLVELQQLRASRAEMAQLSFEAHKLFDIHTEISHRMQAQPLTDDIDGQVQQAEMRAALARRMIRHLEGQDHPGHTEQWTLRRDFRQGLGGS